MLLDETNADIRGYMCMMTKFEKPLERTRAAGV